MTDTNQDGEAVRSDDQTSSQLPSQPANAPVEPVAAAQGESSDVALAREPAANDAAPPTSAPLQGDVRAADETPQENSAADLGAHEGDQAQPSGDESGDHEADRETAPGETLICVRYGRMNALGLFRSKTGEILRHTRVVIKSDRGLEIGTVLCKGSPQLAYEGKPLRRMGTIRRVATHDDLMEEKHLLQAETRARKFCEQHIRDRGLPMQLVAVEHLFGGDRIIFYFLAEGRVDFRDLVKDLAHEFQTRIEMRQIGVRDEARLLADYERCGQFICCRAFIKEFQPISMKMAKVQKATLDPSKISGRCGRLMCCLRYENETYNELKKSLPRKNSYVQTEMGPGKVLGGDILTQLVKVSIAGKTQIVPVDALIARDLSEEQYQAALSAKPVRIGGPGRDGGRRPDGGDSGQRRRPDRSSGGREDRRPARSESAAVQPQQAAASSSDEGESEPAFSEAGTAGQDQPSKRKRRGRRRRKPRGDRPASTGDSGSEGGKKDRDLGVPRAVLEDFGIVSGGDRGSQRSKGSDRGKGSQGNGPREGGAQKDRQGGGKEDQPRSRRRRGRRSHRRGRGGSGGEGNKGGSPGADGASQ